MSRVTFLMSKSKDNEMLVLADYLESEGLVITAVFCLDDLTSQVAKGEVDVLLLQEIKNGNGEMTPSVLNRLGQIGCTIPTIIVGHYPAKEWCTQGHISIASSYPQNLPELAKKIKAALTSHP